VGRATVSSLLVGVRWHAPAGRRTALRWGLWARLLSGHFVRPVVPRTPAPTGRQIRFQAARPAEVAAIVQLSPKTVSRWATEGKLPFLKTLGGHRRYPAAEIHQLASRLQVQPTA
jgi:excisionase family DNA binding protein